MLTDQLIITYNTNYVKQLVPDASHLQSQKALNALAKMYNEDVGINRKLITLTTKGIMSGLL